MMNDEVKNKPELPEVIASGKFVIVGSGDGYQGKIVDGKDLYPTMMEWMYGPAWKEDASREAQDAYWNELCDVENNWRSDQGPNMWDTEVGETDHISIQRITE